jgi:hypothetical protein
MRDTNKLIEELSRDAKPVKPLASPLLRAAALLACIAAAMAAYTVLDGHFEETITHLASPNFALELGGALTAGVGAVVAAVMLSIPGRSQAWTYLPLPGLALWVIGGGLECYRQVDELGYVPVSMFASRDCFLFIVGIGLPTAAATYVFLRRHLTVDAIRVTALSTLGAALLAATLLQFIHTHGTNPVDFGTHVIAVLVLTLLVATIARFEFRR